MYDGAKENSPLSIYLTLNDITFPLHSPPSLSHLHPFFSSFSFHRRLPNHDSSTSVPLNHQFSTPRLLHIKSSKLPRSHFTTLQLLTLRSPHTHTQGSGTLTSSTSRYLHSITTRDNIGKIASLLHLNVCNSLHSEPSLHAIIPPCRSPSF